MDLPDVPQPTPARAIAVLAIIIILITTHLMAWRMGATTATGHFIRQNIKVQQPSEIVP